MSVDQYKGKMKSKHSGRGYRQFVFTMLRDKNSRTKAKLAGQAEKNSEKKLDIGPRAAENPREIRK